MKTFAVAVLAALSISLAAGCGSSDNTISQDQYNAFHAKASAIIASLGKIQPEATACTTNNSSNPPAAFTCLGGLMTKLGAGVGALGTYMGDLSKNVSGACATDLKSASAAATPPAGESSASLRRRRVPLDGAAAAPRLGSAGRPGRRPV